MLWKLRIEAKTLTGREIDVVLAEIGTLELIGLEEKRTWLCWPQVAWCCGELLVVALVAEIPGKSFLLDFFFLVLLVCVESRPENWLLWY